MQRIQAILFDFDGTLNDSESFHFDCWNELLSPYNIRLDFEHYMKEYAGGSLFDNTLKLRETYQLDMGQEEMMEARYNISLKRLADHPVRLMPHARETLAYFNGKKIVMGLVTSSARAEVDIVLAKAGIQHFFQTIITRDDVTMCKPYPEPYELAISYIGFPAEAYIVLEDSKSGVTAAREAGLTCIAVQHDNTERAKLAAITEHSFADLETARNYIVENFDLAAE